MTEPLSPDQMFIRKLTDIVLANLGKESFGVKDLAQESGLSRYVLTKRLYALTNKNINQFIREVRLQKAKEMLKNKSLTVSEVAYRTGFSSPSYFTLCFHDFFGYPPGKVKEGVFESQKENILSQNIQHNTNKYSVRRSFIYLLSGLIFLTIVVPLVYIFFVKDSPAISGITEMSVQQSIAILPCKNLSNNISDQYFYDGIMEEIFNSLCKIHDLRIISRTSVEQYRNTAKTIPVIGKELGVNYIIEISGQKLDGRFRLWVQLIETSTDSHIWGESYQRKINNPRKIFRIQRQIAQNVATKLKVTITSDERELIEKIPTTNMSVYNLYLKANTCLKEYEKTRNLSSYQTSVNLYSSAFETDTAFAKAYTGLAFAYWSRYYHETYFEENYLDSCLILANKALSLDDQLDDAYLLKGKYYGVNGQLEEALENFNNALSINPNYYQAFYWKGYFLTLVQGDYVKGLDNFHDALNLVRGEERSEIMKALGVLYRDAGFVEKAKYYFHEAFLLDNNQASYLGNLAWVEFCCENFEEALKLWRQKEEIDSTSISSMNYYFVTPGHENEAYFQAKKDVENFKISGSLNLIRSHRVAYAFWQAGKRKEAEYYFNQQIKYGEESIKLGRIIERRKVAQYDLAGTYAFLGDKEKAYKYLDEVVQRRTFPLWWVTLAKYDLLFESTRNEERFQQFLQIIESKYHEEHERVQVWLDGQAMLQ